MRLALCLSAFLAAVACSTGPKALPKPDGNVFKLNPERWAETVNDVRQRTAQGAAR